MTRAAALRHRLAIVGAAVLFSTGGAAIKGCALTGWQVAGMRSAVAALALALLVPAARRGWSGRLLAVGLAYAATMVLFVQSNKLTTAANTIFLQSAAPLYLLVLSPLLLGERIRARDLVVMLAISLGLGLFYVSLEPPKLTAPDPLLGNVLATGAGVSWALTLLGLRWLGRDEATDAAGGAIAAVLLGNLLAVAVCAPLALPFALPRAHDLLLVGYLGLVQIGLSYLLLTYGFRRVAAFEASLLLLLEPTLSPVWAWLWHGEVPGGWAIAGGIVILAASTAKTWLDQREARQGLALSAS